MSSRRRLARFAVAACFTGLFAPPLSGQSSSDPLGILPDSIRSGALNVSVSLRVALPWDYASEQSANDRYPVLIVLGANDRTVFGSIVANLRLLDHPLGSPVPSLIVVGVASQPVSPWPSTSAAMDSLRPNAGGADAYARFVADELIPWIDSRFRALPYTVVAGHSVYGQLATHAFARAPEAIDAAVAVSPAFWWLNENVNDGSLTADHANRIARRAEGRLYVAVGEFDPWPIRRGAQTFAEQLRNAGTSDSTFSYIQLANENHQTTRHSGFVEGIRWVFSPVSLSSNAVYAAMGGYARDIDLSSLKEAYEESKSAYAAGARLLGLPEPLPARYLAALVRLPPIERRNDPIPIFRLICEDFRRWYPERTLPPACRPD